MNPILWAVVALGVCVVWYRVNDRLLGDFCSPFSLLLIGWVLPLSLRLLNLSSKEHPWHPETVAMAVYATVVMAAVSLCPACYLNRKRRWWNRAAFARMCALLKRGDFTVFLIVLYGVGAVAVIYNELITNPIGVPLVTYLNDPSISRDPYWQWKGGSLWALSIPVFGLAPFFYFKLKIATGRIARAAYLALLFFYPVVALIKLSRSECLYCLTSILVARYYWLKLSGFPARKRRRFVKFALAAFVIAGLAIGSATVFQQVRGSRPMAGLKGNLGFDFDFGEPYDSTISELYSYFALPFENFSNFVNRFPGGYNLGVGVLRPIYSLSYQGEFVRAKLQQIDFDSYLEMLPANTYPYLVTAYAEGGWIGIILAPLIYAFMVNGSYLWYRLRPSVITAGVYYTMISYQWLWVFCNQNFTGIQYYLFGLVPVVTILLYQWMRRRRAASSMLREPDRDLIQPLRTT